MTARRAGAPRLIEWTGERAVPWATDVQVLYEHYHRYLWAQRLVAGRAVLDLGSGEGFGAALLAEAAASVLGVDIDERTVEHAQLNYEQPGLRFEVADVTDLSALPDGGFDAVVAFEILEHVGDQATMLAEIGRLLTPGGLLVTSTPDRRAYSDATGQDNPFHVRELTHDEFRTLLGGRFANVTVLGQRAATGSKIEALDDGASAPGLALHLEQIGDVWREAGPMSAMYLIAVASNGELPPVPGDSSLADFDLALMREAERRAVAGTAGELERPGPARPALGDGQDRLVDLERRLGEASRRLDLPPGCDVIEELTDSAALLQQDTEHLGAERDLLVAEVVEQARECDRLRLVRRQKGQEIAQVQADAESLRRKLRLIEESVVWKILQRTRGNLYAAIGGKHTLPGRAVSRTMREVGRLGTRRRIAASGEGLALEPREVLVVLPHFEAPTASIVIAAHSGALLTERCLRAILHATDKVPYEVIVVDDAADEATKRMLEDCRGVRVLVNDENLGYLRSVNRGTAEARGRYVVQLNNDTEPQPGWLAALVARAEAAPDIGVVVAKLVYPDGVLQEAGGIVWQDGTGWNYGRGGDPHASVFGFVREVDYGSAAAMLVRTELWQQLGGFDERYVPGYYEDVDLCFAARDAGYRVMYEPAATVVHVEGASMGTDPSSGGKTNQERNRHKFTAKWAEALERQHPEAALERISAAADRRPGSTVIVIDHRVPRPDHDAGSLRMWHLITNLIELGHRVTFIPDDWEPMQPYTAELESLGVHVVYGDIHLPALLASLAPSTRLAIVSRPYVAPRYMHFLREMIPHCPIAYDTVDLHYVREARRAELEGNPDLAKSVVFRELELAIARTSDVTLTVSEAEAEMVRRDAPGVQARVVPLANVVTRRVAGRAGRDGLLFVGGFDHTPNADAAIFLARRVMPLVWRRLPDMALTIVGSNATPEVLRLSAPNVRVAGWVKDLEPLLRDSLALVAPLRYGAGVKGKVTQSMSAGLPVVTTALGAEGLEAEHGAEVLLAESAEQFAEQIIRLHGDSDLWAALSAGGQQIITRLGSPDVQRVALAAVLAEFAGTTECATPPSSAPIAQVATADESSDS